MGVEESHKLESVPQWNVIEKQSLYAQAGRKSHFPSSSRCNIGAKHKLKFKFRSSQLGFPLVSTLAEISFQEFQKLDLRVGEIVKAEQIAGSRNLIRMIVDFGFEKRQSVAGLLQYYKPEELIGKKFAFILNLERKRFMGVESQCMVLAAENEKGNVILLKPEKDIEVGSRIR